MIALRGVSKFASFIENSRDIIASEARFDVTQIAY